MYEYRSGGVILQKEEGRHSYRYRDRLGGEYRVEVAAVVVMMMAEIGVNVSSSFGTSKEWIWQAYKRVRG